MTIYEGSSRASVNRIAKFEKHSKESISSGQDDKQNEIAHLSSKSEDRPREYKHYVFIRNERLEEKMFNHNASIRVDPVAPSEIAFSVSTSAGKRNLDVNEPIVFSEVMTDIGSGYNESEDIYTVPMSGVYTLTWTTVSDAH
ncbi:uncharacterized protein LOC132548426 [Ylistrum balloti]|uniref:uncharacterized protein LOC132548426 n=1 Tax=Ylistrum balloti TaxID=509963 RepID=UPI002905B201|nr:uncharacterized protein LOC132548426 [Ylistrum balloti]